MPLGGDCDLLGPFPGRTASGHGTDCERWICTDDDQLSDKPDAHKTPCQDNIQLHTGLFIIVLKCWVIGLYGIYSTIVFVGLRQLEPSAGLGLRLIQNVEKPSYR